jgi:hypothetical protein
MLLILVVVPLSANAADSNGNGSDLSSEEIAKLVNDQFDIVSQGDSEIDTETITAAALIDEAESDKDLTRVSKKEIVSEMTDQVVSIEKNEAETIHVESSLINGDEARFEIHLPLESASAKLIDGVVISEDNDSEFKITTEILEGGIRNCFIIESSESPKSYPIEYTFDENVVLAYGTDENGEPDGSIIIQNESDEMVAIIPKPWAKDSSSKDIETYYEIHDTTITQIVNHNVDGVNYPVVSDPYTFYNFFSQYYFTWNSKYKGYTFSLYPTSTLRHLLYDNIIYYTSVSWDLVYKRYKGVKQWSNTGGMKDQYKCHCEYATSKSNWNLDTWRPDKSYIATVAASCNP